jgi:hypothetical protein
MLNNVAAFIRKKFPYILGFCVVEAGIYYFNGRDAKFYTGFPGLFAIWIYYGWMSKK